MFQRVVSFYPSKEPIKTSTAIIESVVLTFLGVILGFWFTPENQFFSVPGFSWLLIGPFFSGLRYGFAYALNSALLLIGFMWLCAYQLDLWSDESFASTALSLLFIAIGTGEFRNYWQRKVDILEGKSHYLEQRLGEVSHAFNIIKVSHDRLIQRSGSRNTLRDSILAVRRHIMKAQLSQSDVQNLSFLILRIYADYNNIQQAGLYRFNKGTLDTSALAFFGGEFELNLNDPVLKKALTTQATTSLKIELATQGDYEHLLLAIPLVDVVGVLRGIVVVKKMPFRAFREDNIRLMAILAGYIADLISMRSDSEYVSDIDLQCFILQLKRCLHNVKLFELSSSIICLQINNSEQGSSIKALVMERQRGLDSVWSIKNKKGVYCIFILLPLTDLVGVEGYQVRLQKMITEEYHYDSLEEAGITLLIKGLLMTDDINTLIQELFQKMDLENNLWNKLQKK